nr:hypothetical protein GCM10010200_034820 [Actinomadura rugatobispora]
MSRAFALHAALTAAVLGLGVGIAPAAASDTTGAAPADTARTPAWRIADIKDRGHYDWLDEVVATGPANAWAFGGSLSDAGSVPTAERWNGTSWKKVPLPAGLERPISAANASGPRNVWAFGGSDFAGEAFALRWNGRTWSVSKRWPSGELITDAVVLSRRDVWVFGGSRVGPGVGTWRFDGRTWTQVETPPGTLAGADAVAADDIWAVGTAPTGYDMVAHWDGRTWSKVDLPDLPEEDDHSVGFFDIRAQSPHDVWVVGFEYQASEENYTETPLALHFDGTSWRRVQVPDIGARSLRQAIPDGRGGVWFISGTDQPYEAPELLHYANGRWTTARPQRPDGKAVLVYDLTTVPRSPRLWAVGEVFPVDRASADSAIWKHGRLTR